MTRLKAKAPSLRPAISKILFVLCTVGCAVALLSGHAGTFLACTGALLSGCVGISVALLKGFFFFCPTGSFSVVLFLLGNVHYLVNRNDIGTEVMQVDTLLF